VESARHAQIPFQSTFLPVVLIFILILSAGTCTADDQALVAAARNRDGGTVRTLIDEGVDVNLSQPDGTTALHWAAHWDDVQTAELLLRAGANANVANEYYGVTPLSLACTNASPSMVKLLLDAGADPNAVQSTGETALMTASRTGNSDVVEALLAHGADVDAVYSPSGQTALMWAAAEEHPAVIRLLLSHGANVSARSRSGSTPLHFASRQANIESVRLLLAAGAHADQPAADGTAPLLVATVRGRIDVARLLLDWGANPNRAEAGYTALHWACGSWPTTLSGINGIVSNDDEWRTLAGLKTGKLDFVRTLLAHGADPNARITKAPPRVGIGTPFRGSLTGATPFVLAAIAGDAGVMRTLLDHGADPRLGTAQQTTALMAAAGLGGDLSVSFVTEANALEAVRLLLTQGIDVNAANADGDTALHGAAFIKWPRVVRLLAESGANLSAENVRGETPLTAAEQVVQGGSRIRATVRTTTGDLLRQLGAR
jgi:ankyrin repeat protein